jgi:hypothetical protein
MIASIQVVNSKEIKILQLVGRKSAVQQVNLLLNLTVQRLT